ncbi:MAG: hypothetical protein KGH98_01885 [Candidatus Micrarchaeota archaeon]|nr:hypothetical protein [Candidatus Micrarchaeota archaeon]
MDHREVVHESQYQKDLKQQAEAEEKEYDDYVVEDGKRFRVPYKMIKRVVFRDVSQKEMVDLEHAARLQYRLMLQDPIIKASINYVKSTITVLFNPDTAENRREKISVDQLIKFLADEGVHVDRSKMDLEDYDYYKNFYSYAFNPPSIRERPPYGYSMKQWKDMKDEYLKKYEEGNVKKLEKFQQWRKEYEATHWNAEQAEGQNDNGKKPLLAGIFSRKKPKANKDKGFWFHGV